MKIFKNEKSIISNSKFFFNLKYKKLMIIPEKSFALHYQLKTRQKNSFELLNNEKFEIKNMLMINKKNIFGLFRQTKKVDENSNRNKEFKSTNENQKEQEESKKEKEEKKSIFDLEESTKFIEEKVKKNDFYSYLIANTLNSKLKPYYLSYHAFYIELLRSRFISKEHSVCKMRMSFWEESLKNALKGKPIKEPMIYLLKETIQNTGVRKDTLFRMIDYQFFDINRNSEIKTIEELEIYAENTRSLLLYLNLNLLNINNQDAFIAASHLGRGIGIVDIIKRMPSMIRLNYNMIPFSIIEKHGCSYIDLWDRHGNVKEEFYDCILEMSAYAKRHIEIGRSYQDKLPKNTHVAFLNTVEAYEWLLELEKYNFNVLEPNLHKQHSTYVKMMMAKGKKGEY